MEQNNPNPVNGITTIRYQVPVTSQSAEIIISNAAGQPVKSISIGNKGSGQISFNTAKLATGTYHYSLWVEGKQIDTKQLITAR